MSALLFRESEDKRFVTLKSNLLCSSVLKPEWFHIFYVSIMIIVCIMQVMQKHQKYFPLTEKSSNELLPFFIAVSVYGKIFHLYCCS